MEAAALEFSDQFVTPMAAVAGAVADHLLGVLGGLEGIGAISVNNGGDIALRPLRAMRIGICEDVATGRIGPRIEISPGDGVNGIATSGWRGRSHSLGIADAVTVLASSAARADVAATLIANATDVDCAGVERVPASDLSPDSDLGARLVTVDVPVLSASQKTAALAAGAAMAKNHLRRGLIAGCFLSVKNGRKRLPDVVVRKTALKVEEVFHEGGPIASTPLRRVSMIAVVENPFAGRYVEEITGFIDDCGPWRRCQRCRGLWQRRDCWG